MQLASLSAKRFLDVALLGCGIYFEGLVVIHDSRFYWLLSDREGRWLTGESNRCTVLILSNRCSAQNISQVFGQTFGQRGPEEP